MWVRSQDKKRLVDVKNIMISFEGDICSLISLDNREITKIWLGTYSTEEKAMKVLDKIQKYIINEIDIRKDYNYYSMEYSGNYNVRKVVFQMPKDDEVEENEKN